MSTIKGNEAEKLASIEFHSSATALLVSSLLLRRRSMGQIDLARIDRRGIVIGEVKSSGRIGSKQNLRLCLTANYLSQIFSLNSKLILIHASH